MSHTILLMQPNRRQDSRSYADFESGWFSMNGFGTRISPNLTRRKIENHFSE